MDDSSIDILIGLGITTFLLLLGWTAGRKAERRHFRSLEERERELADMFLTDLKTFPGGAIPQQQGKLVMGEVVIATDYLKSFLAKLRSIIGGELRSYQSLMVRARREAILRVLQQAKDNGYNAVCNIRLTTADIGSSYGRKGSVMVEVFAWGTAYYSPESSP